MNKSAIVALITSIPSIAFASPTSADTPLQYGSFSYSVSCDINIANETYCQPPKANKDFSLNLNANAATNSDNIPRYLTTSDGRDWDYLLEQTYTILGLSVATVGLMTLLPESVTKWDSDQRSLSGLGDKWKENVSEGPVWDEDAHYLNYIMHPYFGGVYYTAARHSGFNEFDSFLYSFTMSTFFWEYGVEAFAEVPSWQDLFITPFFGAMVGESMYKAEHYLTTEMDGEVFGSSILGNISLFFLNPVGHIHHWVTDSWGADADASFNTTPWFGNQDAANFAIDSGAPFDSQFVSLNFSVRF
ncbi:DUF3943 domain-containing protein [Vibrio rumoiensis]|uniref:Ubiquitin-protein ligase n=1 Tax=Vibrio rumoiensis 1S-45 TaxID=1188252 RepID=A0A1E5E5J4_9VIBR|nr:DUF3943 domain-containing protein [Vibrio rumoiensis]OEF29179.1 ubiquitin-protein ligase [Vibrio rumoiensis 1S-45]